jgi:hypothetical protein
MKLAVVWARITRPSVQVPLATAWAFAAVAALVMHALHLVLLWPCALPFGVALAAGLSFFAMQRLFRGSGAPQLDAGGRLPAEVRARFRVIAWPPMLAAVVGLTVDLGLRIQRPNAALCFLGLRLVPEALDVAMLSAAAGALGTAVLLPLTLWFQRTRALIDEDDFERREDVAKQLAVWTWAVGLVVSAANLALAERAERSTGVALSAVALMGAAGALLARRRSDAAQRVLQSPYRA